MFRNGSINLHLVVLEDGQLDLPVLVLDLLGGGVVLLLPLLGTSPQPEKIMCKTELTSKHHDRHEENIKGHT